MNKSGCFSDFTDRRLLSHCHTIEASDRDHGALRGLHSVEVGQLPQRGRHPPEPDMERHPLPDPGVVPSSNIMMPKLSSCMVYLVL